MGKRAANIFHESEKELKTLLRKEKNKSLQKRLSAAIISVKQPNLTRSQIATDIGISKRTLERWFLIYRTEGIESYLSIKPKAHKKSVIPEELNLHLKNILRDPNNPLRGYQDTQKYILDKFDVLINYQTLRSYMIRNFGKRLKSSRRVLVIRD